MAMNQENGVDNRKKNSINKRKVFIRRYLMIKEKFLKHILNGIKTTTIRLGKVVAKCNKVIIHSGGKPVAEALIKNIAYKKICELTDEDAKKDGYNSVEELISDLKSIYGSNISKDDVVSLIEFEITRKFSDVDIQNEYLGLPPHTIALLANRYLKNEFNEEEKKVVEVVLKYKSIRAASLKLFNSLEKRWIIRKILKKLLIKLVDKGMIVIDDDTLSKLAQISSMWRKYVKNIKKK